MKRGMTLFVGALAVTLVGASGCAGGPGDASGGGVNGPVGAPNGGGGAAGGDDGNGDGKGNGDGNGDGNGKGNGDSGGTDAGASTTACGSNTCGGGEECVVPCCRGTDAGPCTPPAPYCQATTATVPSGCTRTKGSFVICVCS